MSRLPLGDPILPLREAARTENVLHDQQNNLLRWMRGAIVDARLATLILARMLLARFEKVEG